MGKFLVIQVHDAETEKPATLADGTPVVARVPIRVVQMVQHLPEEGDYDPDTDRDHGTVTLRLTDPKELAGIKDGDTVEMSLTITHSRRMPATAS